MKIDLQIHDFVEKKAHNLSNIVSSIKYDTSLEDQPSKLDFECINQKIKLNEGSRVILKINDKNIFLGYIFEVNITSENTTITAYDQLRYLKNTDTYVRKNKTVSDFFVQICKDYKLKYKVKTNTTKKLSPKLFDNTTLYEMISDSLMDNYLLENKMYIIRDEYGILTFDNIENLKTNMILSDKCLIGSYDFTTSIDSDTFNTIKLVQETEKGKRDTRIVFDSNTQKEWGILQHFETVQANVNEAQILEKANLLLKIKNRKTKILKLESLGILGLKAGNSIILNIDSLQKYGVKQADYLIKSCTHNFSDGKHTMDLEVVLKQ